MRKFTVSGYAAGRMEDALMDALSQASVYVSDRFETVISILELSLLPGCCYKAVISITQVPRRKRRSAAKSRGQAALEDAQLDRAHIRQMLGECFRSLNGCPDIPEYCVTESDMLLYLIKHDFSDAVHDGAPVDMPPSDALPEQEATHVPATE